jgi:hypothetical protein
MGSDLLAGLKPRIQKNAFLIWRHVAELYTFASFHIELDYEALPLRAGLCVLASAV